MLTGRVVRFENHVADAMNYLRAANPERLANVQVDIANVPKTLQHADGMDRWHVEAPNRIILYRVAIDRLARLHCEDPVHYRMLVERCVLQAVAELLGSDPWDIAPERFGDGDGRLARLAVDGDDLGERVARIARDGRELPVARVGELDRDSVRPFEPVLA